MARPLVNRRFFVRPAILLSVAGLVFLWRRASIIAPPFTPPDIGMQNYRERVGGLASMSDNYIMLLSKADAYNKADLLNYLRTLPAMPVGMPPIHVPGDLKIDRINWASTQTQSVALASGQGGVELTPPLLQELKTRRDKLIELGVSPPPPPVANNFSSTLSGVIGRNGNYGDAFICADGVPMYRYPLSTAPGSGLNQKPAGYTAAGMHVYKTAVFGHGSALAGETQIKLFPNSNVFYFVMSDLLKDHCQ